MTITSFEPQTSGAGSDCSTNGATPTAERLNVIQNCVDVSESIGLVKTSQSKVQNGCVSKFALHLCTTLNNGDSE